MKSNLSIVMLAFLLLVGWFLWITPYRYDHQTIGPASLLTRTNRLTGKTHILSNERGWIDLDDFEYPADAKGHRRSSIEDAARAAFRQ
jgi:hypothetical protein